MRKLILIAAMSLVATQAFAGGPRSLSLAATNASQPAAATAPQAPAETPSAEVQTATTTPASTPPATTAPAATAPVANTTEAAKPKHRQPSAEARVIRELHRHGIYW